jgi:hypothetical protein
MLFKSLTAILFILLSVETAYVLTHRRSANRFQPVSGYQGFVPLDSRDVRLCSTMPGKESPSVYKEQADKETNGDLKAELSAESSLTENVTSPFQAEPAQCPARSAATSSKARLGNDFQQLHG